MDYVVERLRAARCRELRVVTRPEKRDLAEHAREVGALVIEATPRTLSESIACGLDGLDASETVLVGLPDTIWEPVDGFARLLERLDGEIEVVLGVFESDEPERSDVVVLDEAGGVESVHVKQARPPGSLVWGCFAARVGALAGVEQYDEVGQFFGWLAESGAVQAVLFPGKLVDVGTPEALERVRA